MIPEWRVQQIKALLAADLTQREVARRVGVSRSTVHAIANGRRRARSSARPPRSAPAEQKYSRCPGCGGLVLQPCRLCRPPADHDEPHRAKSARPEYVPSPQEIADFYAEQARRRQREQEQAQQRRQDLMRRRFWFSVVPP
jgi:hypothetical protein